MNTNSNKQNNQMTDIFQMAQQIAKTVPMSGSENGNVDMQDILKHVSASVSKMMGVENNDLMNMANSLVSNFEDGGSLESIIGSQLNMLKEPKENKKCIEEIDEENDEEDDEEDEFRPRTKDLHYNLNVDLEDFYNGKVKKLKIERKRIKKDNKGKISVVKENKKIAIPIEKGMRDEQVITFNKEADELPGKEAGDIVITICENPHPIFERDGDNLFIVKKVSLYETFAVNRGESIDLEVKHLDGRIIKMKTDKKVLHSNEGIRKIKGEGMPLYKKDGYGDLFIRFNLDIPDSVSKEDLEILKSVFPPLNLPTNSKDFVECQLEDVTEEDLEALDYYSEEEDSDEDSDESEVSEESEYSEEYVDKRELQRREHVEKMRQKLRERNINK